MKVKLFTKSNPLGRKGKNQDDFENEINAWLQQNPSIKVVEIKQSPGGESLSQPLFFISVWYEKGA